jgi:uncharacterized protein (DUF169 family)
MKRGLCIKSVPGGVKMIYEDKVKDLKEALGLEWSPISITFSDNPDPEGSMDTQVSACKALEKVLYENAVINLSKENLLCIGGKFYLGLDNLPLSVGIDIWTEYHKGFESKKVTKWQMIKGPKPPGFWPWTKRKQKPFVIISPLEKANLDPHVVLTCCNPEQADRITALIAFSGYGPIKHYPANSVCMPMAYPYVTGKSLISFLSRHGREIFKLKIPSSNLFVSIPSNDFGEAVENIPHSGYGTAKSKKLTIKIMYDLMDQEVPRRQRGG